MEISVSLYKVQINSVQCAHHIGQNVIKIRNVQKIIDKEKAKFPQTHHFCKIAYNFFPTNFKPWLYSIIKSILKYTYPSLYLL